MDTGDGHGLKGSWWANVDSHVCQPPARSPPPAPPARTPRPQPPARSSLDALSPFPGLEPLRPGRH